MDYLMPEWEVDADGLGSEDDSSTVCHELPFGCPDVIPGVPTTNTEYMIVKPVLLLKW